MTFQVSLCQLTPAFYAAYPLSQFPEIMQKDARPYTCLMIETHTGYWICIPFRSSIHHNQAFLFTNTERSLRSRSGLDYKKTVLIKDSSYLDTTSRTVVDNDEYIAMITHIETIVLQIHSYITNYINHINGTIPLHHREFQRRYQYSTLPYFHNILGLPSKE